MTSFLCGLIVRVQPAIAQEMYFTNISNTLNLPSQECYNVIQDSKGYIWICTENGLVKYSKGYSRLFDKKNGLYENAVYFISEYPQGEIQLFTSNNRILSIKNDSLRELPYTRKVQDYLRKNSNANTFDLGYLISRKRNGDLVINSQQRTFLISNETGNIVDLTKNKNVDPQTYIVLFKDNAFDYFVKNNTGVLFDVNNNNRFHLIISKGPNSKELLVELDEETRMDWRTRICNINGNTFLTIHNKLIQADEQLNVKITSFPSVITCIYANKDHGLWVGTSSNGVYHYNDITNLNEYTHGLSGLTISSVLVDKEGGAWCATTEKGIYYSANYNVTYYPEVKALNKKTTFMKSDAGNLFLSTEIDKLTYLEKNQFKSTEILNTGNGEITDICRFKNQYFIANKGYLGVLDKDFKLKQVILKTFFPPGNLTTYQLDTSVTSLYALGVGLIYRINGSEIKPVGPSLPSKGRCMKVMNDTIVYVGCNDGLYKINLLSIDVKKIGEVSTPVTKILLSNSGKIYFTTKGEGLFKLIDEKAIAVPLDGDATVLNDIVEAKNNLLWISSNNGLIALSTDVEKTNSRRYNTSAGLVSNNIGHLAIHNNYLYISSPDGVFRFPLETDLVNHTPSKVYLNEIRVNDSISISADYDLEFEYWQNSITFSFDLINFKQGNKECLLYQLKGRDSDFQKNYSNVVVFENLSPNTYELVVNSMNSDGVIGSEPLRFKFRILPPFWQTWWFVFLLVIVSLLIIFMTVKMYIDTIRRSEEEKTRVNKLISESQLSALQAQMNPHFIFNAINSIQNYILEKKEDDAYDYLVKFSKLVRLVLNNSREKEISLHAELEMLQLYVSLEQLRFDKSFEFILQVSDDLNLFEIEIPTMLIQPYVENAIWHGLMNLNGERQAVLKIDISQEDNILRIDIQDNGIGRARSNAFKRDSLHHSVGMQLTEKRIEMINTIWNLKNVQVSITDLYDEQQESMGTKVELFLSVLTS